MREFLTDTSTPLRRAVLKTLTIVLWLISVALGAIALILAPEMAALLALLFFADPQETVRTQGIVNVTRVWMYFCGGLALLIIFFSGFVHLERGIGSIRSMQILAGLIVAELLLILSRPVIISLLQL
jgi:hypothetical protein